MPFMQVFFDEKEDDIIRKALVELKLRNKQEVVKQMVLKYEEMRDAI